MQPDEFKKRSLQAAISYLTGRANRIEHSVRAGDAVEYVALTDKVRDLEAELAALENQ